MRILDYEIRGTMKMLAPLLASQEYKDAGSGHNKPRPVFPQIAILLDGESRLRSEFLLVRRFTNYAQKWADD